MLRLLAVAAAVILAAPAAYSANVLDEVAFTDGVPRDANSFLGQTVVTVGFCRS